MQLFYKGNAVKDNNSCENIPVWEMPQRKKESDDGYFELSEDSPVDIHFSDRLKEVYPQLIAYEKELKQKIERSSEELRHIQTQIARIKKILENGNDR